MITSEPRNSISLSDIPNHPEFTPKDPVPHRPTDAHQACSEHLPLKNSAVPNSADLADFFHLCVVFKETTF